MASDFSIEGSRIADAGRTWLALEDADVAGFIIGSDFIIAFMMTTSYSPSKWEQIRVEWRNVTDVGSWTAFSGSGELKYGYGTDLVNGNNVIHAEEGCTSANPGNHEDGEEIEGSIFYIPTISQNYHEEWHFAINTDGAHPGDRYEFQIYSITESVVIGVLLADITMSSATTSTSTTTTTTTSTSTSSTSTSTSSTSTSTSSTSTSTSTSSTSTSTSSSTSTSTSSTSTSTTVSVTTSTSTTTSISTSTSSTSTSTSTSSTSTSSTTSTSTSTSSTSTSTSTSSTSTSTSTSSTSTSSSTSTTTLAFIGLQII